MSVVQDDEQVFAQARTVLRGLMKANGVTQMDLVPVLGIPQQVISNRLTGRSRLTLAEVRRAALFFGVSPQVFFEELSSPSVSLNDANAYTPIAA